MAEDLETALRGLVTEQLSSVTFVMDYWQLAFDGFGLTITDSSQGSKFQHRCAGALLHEYVTVPLTSACQLIANPVEATVDSDGFHAPTRQR